MLHRKIVAVAVKTALMAVVVLAVVVGFNYLAHVRSERTFDLSASWPLKFWADAALAADPPDCTSAFSGGEHLFDCYHMVDHVLATCGSWEDKWVSQGPPTPGCYIRCADPTPKPIMCPTPDKEVEGMEIDCFDGTGFPWMCTLRAY